MLRTLGQDRNRMGSHPVPSDTPIVFVVDDDVSIRESLELLFRSEGWQAEIFESAWDFLARPRSDVPN